MGVVTLKDVWDLFIEAMSVSLVLILIIIFYGYI
jgi:cbb3-type cytochrome oxidase subunit 3